PARTQDLDHHLRRELGPDTHHAVTDVQPGLPPDPAIGAADVRKARLLAPPHRLDQFADEHVAPTHETAHVGPLLDHLPRRPRSDHHIGIFQVFEELAEIFG